jgi:hypothetical protein
MARTEQAAYQTKLSPQDYPATLFREFEYDLGQINIHVCAADAALREYTARVLETPAFLRLSVQRWGHRHLNPNELNINRMLDLSYASHIALLLSRMDQLCQRVRRHPFVNMNRSSEAQGDFLRKTLWLVLVSQSETKLSNPLDSATVEMHLGSAEVRRFDAFRGLRNDELHAGDRAVLVSDNADRLLHPRFVEVLDCSKTLQVIARRLCRALSGTPTLITPILVKRFGSLKPARRKNAASSALAQEFMLEAKEVQQVIHELVW